MLLRTVIVDNERVGRQRLRRLLVAEAGVEIVAEYGDGLSALDAVEEDQPDLVLLDIQMPQMDGFEVLEKLGAGQLPLVVFVTGFDQHAVHAFDTRAVDYLLKPVTAERLHHAINRVRKNLRLIRRLAPVKEETRYPRRFSIRSGAHTCFVAPEEIDWIESAGNYAVLHVGNRNHVVRETMSTLERELARESFLRVSRSAIIHLPRVKELETVAQGHHCAVLDNGERVLLTRSVREVQERLRDMPVVRRTH